MAAKVKATVVAAEIKAKMASVVQQRDHSKSSRLSGSISITTKVAAESSQQKSSRSGRRKSISAKMYLELAVAVVGIRSRIGSGS